jgi:hypothetical protein
MEYFSEREEALSTAGTTVVEVMVSSLPTLLGLGQK